jgi:hypothetical protein
MDTGGKRWNVPGPAECVQELAEQAWITLERRITYDWPEIERGISLRLPADYKLLAEYFPTGWFRRFVRLAKPERPVGEPQRLDSFAMEQLETLREWRAAGHGSFPYPIYPEPGGLLPWGAVREGGYAFWLTEPAADPDGWPVVVVSQECDYWDRFDGSVCEFLSTVATARYDARGFTERPLKVVIDPFGVRQAGQPITLADRPVFEPDSIPSDEELPARGTQPDFWLTRLQKLDGGSPPANEMARLRELIGTPPIEVPKVDWAAVHARLGFRLPTDYREFIDTYGPGTLGDIRITAPGAPGDLDLYGLLQRKYAQVRDLERWAAVDPPFYPEPGGAVCWGETVGGWTCAWAPVSADPDEWTVTAIMPTWNLRGLSFQAGLSFSAMLREHADQDPVQHGLVPPRDPSAGPVTFTPQTLAGRYAGQ